MICSQSGLAALHEFQTALLELQLHARIFVFPFLRMQAHHRDNNTTTATAVFRLAFDIDQIVSKVDFAAAYQHLNFVSSPVSI